MDDLVGTKIDTMKKLTLYTEILFGEFKGKTLKEYADKKWYGFKKWYDNKPYLFDNDVDKYVEETKQAIYRNRR